jgi:Domain of unknown function (DUF4337)
MAEVDELAEHIEHAGHAGSLGKYLGITMACLGVLLALCAALVGGQRTELIATMVEQTNASMKYQAISTKYRVLLAQLRQLHALNPDAERFQQWDDESRKLVGQISSADVARAARVNRLENAKNLNAEIPTHEDLVGFATVIRALDTEKEAALEWSESYESATQVHSMAAEHYEWAQLACEIGIVVASIALLFMSRPAWLAALVLFATAVVIVSITFVSVSSQLHGAEQKIHDANQRFVGLNGEQRDKEADEELLKSVETEKTPTVDPK